MSKRHSDALAIQQGACNPSGIAISIVKACQECRAEGGDVRKDPAIRLMAHQLAYICGVSEIDDAATSVYRVLYEACEKNAGEDGALQYLANPAEPMPGS